MAALSWHSLKLRLPLLIVVLFLGGLWALAGFANYQLRHDMRHQIERQQRSVAALAAQALEHTLQERQAILLRVARHFAPVLEHAPEQLTARPQIFVPCASPLARCSPPRIQPSWAWSCCSNCSMAAPLLPMPRGWR
jgi:hypothetical protein